MSERREPGNPANSERSPEVEQCGPSGDAAQEREA